MTNKKNNLLFIDTAFSYESIINRGLEKTINYTDLNGFFNHVWFVHPFASLVNPSKDKKIYGKIQIINHSKKHTVIEGKVGYLYSLRIFPKLNFFISQIYILIKLYLLIKKNKINVINAMDPLLVGFYAYLLSRLCNIPYVIRVVGNYDKISETMKAPIMPNLFKYRKIEKIVEKFVFSRANLVAGNNNDNLNYALSNGAKKKYSTVFRYGNIIDQKHFVHKNLRPSANKIITELGLQSKYFISYIGRLEKVKHPEDVLEVLAYLNKKNHNLSCLMIGDGKMKKDLIVLAEKKNILNNVIFCGNRDQSWLSIILPLSKIVISPHTGRALSEAALASVPVVAYDIDWQSELITTGVTGELVPYRDVTSLSKSAEKFLNNLDYSNLVSENIRNKALTMMDPEKLNIHEINEYNKLLKNKNL